MKALLTVGVVILTLLATTGCDRYRVTVNERAVYEPPPLFTDFRIADRALADCLAQTIEDHRITQASELVALHCSHAGIASTEGLEQFGALEQLDLSDNAISDIDALLFLDNLRSVKLEGNSNLDCEKGTRLSEQIDGEVRLPEHCLEAP